MYKLHANLGILASASKLNGYACTINNDAVIYTTGSGLVEFSNKGKWSINFVDIFYVNYHHHWALSSVG